MTHASEGPQRCSEDAAAHKPLIDWPGRYRVAVSQLLCVVMAFFGQFKLAPRTAVIRHGSTDLGRIFLLTQTLINYLAKEVIVRPVRIFVLGHKPNARG